jgi:hypothetical protein
MERFFIVLGAQKAGTSWLGEVLSSSAEVFLPFVQELHYFDTKFGVYRKNETLVRRREILLQRLEAAQNEAAAHSFRERIAQVEAMIAIDSDTAYRAFFERFSGDRPVAGEKTPNYAVLPEAAYREMAGIFPDTRLLFVLRSPVSRFWSQFRFHNERVKRSARDLTPYDDPFAALKHGPFARKNDYRAVIEKLRAALPEERRFLEYYERLTRCDDAIGRLFAFLGLTLPAPERLAGLRARQINASAPAPMPEGLRAHAARELRPVYDFVFAAMPGEPPAEWLADYNAGLPE